MKQQFVMQTAETIRQQLFGLTDFNVICSWGIKPPLRATIVNSMASLKFDVNARLHKGFVIIAYDEGDDYYKIYLQAPGKSPYLIAEDIDFTQLGDVIDTAIESGTNKAEYDAFCEEERRKLMNGIFD